MKCQDRNGAAAEIRSDRIFLYRLVRRRPSTSAAALMRPWVSSSGAAMYWRSNCARAALKVAPIATGELPFKCSRDRMHPGPPAGRPSHQWI